MSAHHWPDPEGVEAVNALLSLPANGQEQDWEIELADSERLVEFLDLIERGMLDLEGRSALALLILFSVTYAKAEISDDDLERVRRAIRSDQVILDRLRNYWSDGFLDHEDKVKSLIA